MKFAHFSDCHLGGWREPRLRALGVASFRKAMQECVQEYVGFILIAGDLFDTALPAVDVVKDVIAILREVHEHDIPIYVIPGSHDYSPSGKTVIDIFEKAGLVENVAKAHFTQDRTGIKVIGVHGRKGALEREDYQKLDKQYYENETGVKIFLFHTLLEELKPLMFQHVEGLSIQHLPKGFYYYAGGHPHMQYSAYYEGYGMVAYPGPTFPNNFKELEELECGRYLMVDLGEKLVIQHRKIPLQQVCSYAFSADGKTADVLQQEMRMMVQGCEGKIVLVRVEGCLDDGEINWKAMQDYFSNAFVFLKNTAKLTKKSYQQIAVDRTKTIEELEETIIVAQGMEQGREGKDRAVQLMRALNLEKLEGERNSDFEARVVREVKPLLRVE